MEIKPGLSALVTGGASGIGKALSLALAEKGVFVTIVDLSEESGNAVASLIEKQNAKFHPNSKVPYAQFVRCDVTNSGELAAAFDKHVESYGGLDIGICCAGIRNPINFYEDETDGARSWRHTVNVNFVAVIDFTRLAIKAMQTTRKPGVIINLGSAAGLQPLYHFPIYCGCKGGVVMFTRSLVPYQSQGVRVNVLCPEFVETEMTRDLDPKLIGDLGGFVPMEMVIKGAFELITDKSKAGSCLHISNNRGLEYWPTPGEEARYFQLSSSSKQLQPYKAPVNHQLPQTFEKVIVHTLSQNFRNATHIIRAPLKLPIESHQVLLKVIYAGVNASDVNFSSGRCSTMTNLNSELPFDAGLEAVGIIAALGDLVTNLKVGTPAVTFSYGSYAEFIAVPSEHILPVPRPDPEAVAMLTSGLTASIALEKAGQMDSGRTVLVTAAAGGTGQFAIQLAKLAGNQVVATCGGKEKVKLLQELGVDRIIDYKAEDIETVLKKEYPEGVDIIYESVGGEMFELCLNALAVCGRLIVIGMISKYQEDGWTPSNCTGLCERILAKSQTVAGFFLLHYRHLWQQHLSRLFDLYSAGKLKVCIDPRGFFSVHAVADAVEYLHSGRSVGKVVVCIDPTFAKHTANSEET